MIELICCVFDSPCHIDSNSQINVKAAVGPEFKGLGLYGIQAKKQEGENKKSCMKAGFPKIKQTES